MEDNRHDELDNLLDRALSGYSAAEPLAGLEDRVLNRVRTVEAARRRYARWWWTLAIPALASLVIVGLAHRSGPVPIPKRVETARSEPAPQPPPPEPEAVPIAAPRPSPVRALPKRDRFPTPSALTRDERALIAVAQHYPAALEKLSADPIAIPLIEIPPLRGSGEQ